MLQVNSSKILAMGASTIVLSMYTQLFLWRPNISKSLSLTLFNWYLPLQNIASVSIVGIVLLVLTKNIFVSLLSGAFATLSYEMIIWNTINQYYGNNGHFGGITYPIMMLLLGICLMYFVKPISTRIIWYSGGIYVITMSILALYPNIVALSWYHYLGYGTWTSPNIFENLYALVQRTSGYLFLSLGVIKVFAKK